MYLLDTNVISELRKVKSPNVNPNVLAWAKSVPSETWFLSSITILELEIGVLQKELRDPTQGSVLRSWLDGQVLAAFTGRILPVDTEVAQRCAKLHVPNPRSDHDALIAATALVHEMTVVTRNVADFSPTGVATTNPWEPEETG